MQGNESQSLSDALKDIAMIPFNFSFKENHMWYIYLLIGLYLYMPFFSAWIEGGSFQREGGLFRDMVRISFSCLICLPISANIYTGEATLESIRHVYYFAGFNGYLLLGHYLKQGNNGIFGKPSLFAQPCLWFGYAITYCGFSSAAANPEATELDMELFFTFCSPNVVLMTAAVFILLQKVRIHNTLIAKKTIENIQIWFRNLYRTLFCRRSDLYLDREV